MLLLPGHFGSSTLKHKQREDMWNQVDISNQFVSKGKEATSSFASAFNSYRLNQAVQACC